MEVAAIFPSVTVGVVDVAAVIALPPFWAPAEPAPFALGVMCSTCLTDMQRVRLQGLCSRLYSDEVLMLLTTKTTLTSRILLTSVGCQKDM